MFSLSDSPDYRVPDQPDDEVGRRIVGVMPLVTGVVRRWLRHSPASLRAEIGIEDALQAIWAALLAADRQYDPDRARYSTFAANTASWTLGRLAEKHRRSPRREPMAIEPADDRVERPDESAERAEHRQRAGQAVNEAMGRLDDPAFFVIARTHGIGDAPEMTTRDLAAWLVRSPSEIVAIRNRAERQLRNDLATAG